MMHKSPAIRIAGMISWILTALAAIIFGLGNLDIADIYGRLIDMGFPLAFLTMLNWAFLLAGAVSLGMFVMAMVHHCGSGNGQSSCK